MKNRILTIIVILTYLTLPESSFGQQSPSDYGRVTPQTADFMRYGDIPRLGVGSAYVGLKASVHACKWNEWDKNKKRYVNKKDKKNEKI